jgi:rfaE bifunctional protein kinase chain/domain
MVKATIQSLFDSFTGMKVLIVGDVMIDAYMWGRVERISPEAPVPVISCTRRENRLGGAANVALNVKALGAEAVLCSVIGNDDNGMLYKELMLEEQLSCEGIVEDRLRPTTVKTRMISGNQQLLRVDEETEKPLSPETEKKFIEHVVRLIKDVNFAAVIFQDYDKGVITPEVINAIVQASKEKGLPTLVDPKRRNFENYNGVTLFKPNFKEFTEGLKISVQKTDGNALFEAAKNLHQKEVELVMVTLSEQGVFISNGHVYNTIPAHHREITDVSGAGDTVISVASVCLAAGLEMSKVAAISNLAGGLVCEKLGVVPVHKQKLMEECDRLSVLE